MGKGESSREGNILRGRVRKMKDKTSSVKCLLEEFFSKLGREGVLTGVF